MYGNGNADLPTLNPWVLTTAPPAQRFVFERNPYYYRIDPKGMQLPYIDGVIITVVGGQPDPRQGGPRRSRPAAALSQHARLHLPAEERQDIGHQGILWESGSGSQLALYPNLNASDEPWRKLMRDVRFRRALSLAIDRDELNEVRLPRPGQAVQQHGHGALGAVQARVRDQVGELRPKLANKLLDEVGLNKRGADGIRLLPDGRAGNHRGRACRARRPRTQMPCS